MTTLRSHYQYEQFEEVLQKLAHKTAKEAVENPPQTARINIDDHTVTLVETDNMSIRFYFEHVKVEKTLSPAEDGPPLHDGHNWISFDVEKKLYINSNHCSKISFWAPEGEEKKKTKQVEDFLDELMSDVMPVARFSLEKYIDPPEVSNNG